MEDDYKMIDFVKLERVAVNLICCYYMWNLNCKKNKNTTTKMCCKVLQGEMRQTFNFSAYTAYKSCNL